MRLLIVEDDEETACALASGLERGGFSTVTAHTGEEGFFLLLLIGIKFVRVFSSSQRPDKAAATSPAAATAATNQTAVETKP